MGKEPWIARLLDGPFAERDATIGTEPEGKEIRVWESVLVGGSLMHDEKLDELLPGDCVYKEEVRSTLPEGFHENVVRGGQYSFVREEKGDEDGE